MSGRVLKLGDCWCCTYPATGAPVFADWLLSDRSSAVTGTLADYATKLCAEHEVEVAAELLKQGGAS